MERRLGSTSEPSLQHNQLGHHQAPRAAEAQKSIRICLAVCRRLLISGIDLLWWTLRFWEGVTNGD